MIKLVYAALLALLLASGVIVSLALAASSQDEKKVIVCKYVGTPGVDERLQTGDNPISVSVNALEGKGFAGSFPFEFSDAQGRSVAVRFAIGNERGTLADCGVTTTSTTTTSSTSTTTTTTPTTTGTPRETFFAGAVCDLANSRYVVSGEVDGQPATVIPQFIPGDKQGTSLVIVTLGSFTGVATVNTAGTCVSAGTTSTTTPGTTTSPGGGGAGGGGTTSTSGTSTGSLPGTTTASGGTTTGIGGTTTGTSSGTTTGPAVVSPPPDNAPAKPAKPAPGSPGSPVSKPPTGPTGAPCVIRGHEGLFFHGKCVPAVAGKG